MTTTDRSLTDKGVSTRDRIVAAARTMLLERGYEGLVLRELAQSLGITVGNLQYYFGTREALALHVLDIESARDAELITEQRQLASPREAFRTVVHDMATRYRSESGHLLLMMTALAQHNLRFRDLIRASYAEFYPLFEALIQDMNPGLSPTEASSRARLINALVEGSAFQVDLGDVDAFLHVVLAEAETIALASPAR
ncbi:MAG: TetR/AcrR family transcriptional regulator [Actinomycetota bacterium]